MAGTCLRVIDYGLTRASLPVASLTSAEDLSRGDDSMAAGGATCCGASSAVSETFFSDLLSPQNRAQRPTGVTHATTAPTLRDGNRCIIDFEPHGLAVHAKIDLHE